MEGHFDRIFCSGRFPALCETLRLFEFATTVRRPLTLILLDPAAILMRRFCIRFEQARDSFPDAPDEDFHGEVRAWPGSTAFA